MDEGVIPQKLAKVPATKCPSCFNGKAHQKPWTTHKVDPKIKQSTIHVTVTSIDQLELPVQGFVPIAKGQLTTIHYQGAMGFIDHTSDFTYVHLDQGFITDETLEVKHAFECITEPAWSLHPSLSL